MTTAHRASEVKYQNGNDVIADIKKHQSGFVILISDFFTYAKNATKIVMTPETPIGQAPTPPPPSNCAKKTMNVVEPQITQENTWGFTSFFKY